MDWVQYVFLVSLANATGKKPPEFRRAERPTDKALAAAKKAETKITQERTTRVLSAMRTGDWSEVPEVDRSKFTRDTH